ncbi:unnamed protein product [Prunus armeniaca]
MMQMGLESAPIVMVITLLRSDFKLHGYPEWWEALKTHNLAPKAACIVTSDVSSSHNFLPDSNLDSDLTTHKTIGPGKWREGLFSLVISSPPSSAHARSASPNSHVQDQH